MASKVLKVAVGLLTGVSLCLPPEMAEAGPFGWGGHPGVYGGYRGGWVGHRPHPIYAGGGYYGGYGYGYPGAYGGYGYGYPAYYGGYGYPAYYGGYYPGYYGYYRR